MTFKINFNVPQSLKLEHRAFKHLFYPQSHHQICTIAYYVYFSYN